jgi:peptidoglycan/LPS O-acetylase OafA/YrhL
VQLFFLLSGYIICKIYANNLNSKNNIKNFYIKRFLTIVPLYWLFIIIFILFNFIFENKFDLKKILLSFFFLDYLNPSTFYSIVIGGWSIVAELYFYTIFPILIFIFKKNASKYLTSAILINLLYNVFIKKFLYEHYILDFNFKIINDYLSLNFLNQISCFLLGCYVFFDNKNFTYKNFFLILSWIILSISLNQNFIITNSELFYVILQISFIYFLKLIINFNLYIKFIAEIGEKSYGIYLVHWIVIFVLCKFLHTNNNSILYLIFIATLTVIFSYLLTKIIISIIITKINNFKNKLVNKKN